MDTKYAEALSAFFDGERVDAALLAESLAQPGSSALLAEFAAMRAQVEADDCRPRPEFFQATAEKLRRLKVRRLWRRRFARLALAAGLAILVGVAGFMLGSRRGYGRPEPLAQATPAAAAPASAPSPPFARSAPAAAPRPSRGHAPPHVGGPPNASLRLRFGQFRPAPAGADTESERR